MKLINETLYLELLDAVECGFGDENYLYKEKSRGARWGLFIKDPVYQNKILIEYESLHPRKKELVIKKYGNPYENFAKAPIRKMITKDFEAEKFFTSYKYNDTDNLKPETIEKYTTAASWLNLLVKAKEDIRYIKNTIGISISEFWIKIFDIIREDKINLPTSYRRLNPLVNEYKEKSYQCLLHKNLGNDSSKKVKDEVSESLLLELISMPNSDDVITTRRYNKWAAENNKPQITRPTVNNYRKKHEAFITLFKKGTRANYDKFGKHIIRKRPSAPLLLIEHDDNELDLYFQSKEPKTSVYYFNRFVIAVVIDAYNDYILGWAYAKTYTKELIRFAYLDAMYHIKELTGDWHLPHQIRCDHFGLDPKLQNDLAQFYRSLAIFTPATAKVARGKYIEQSFGKKWHQALSCYPNYAGTNVKSKYQVNQDFQDANKKDFPTTEQAPAQILQFINTLRHLVNEKTNLSKQEEWLTAFRQSEKSKQKQISELQLLLKLGTPHTHSNKITNRGITPSINCKEHTYEIPEEYYHLTVGSTVQIIYEPMDYSRILVTDNQKLLFIAREQEAMPSAIADYKEGDRKKLNDRLEEKVRFMQMITEAKNEREEILRLNNINTESLIMAGVHSKAINHQALVDYVPMNNLEEPLKRNKKQLPKPKTIDDMLDQM